MFLFILRVFQEAPHSVALPLLALYELEASFMLMTSVYAPPIPPSCRP